MDETFAEERKVGIDAALSKLEGEHQQQVDELRAKHEKELKALEGSLIKSYFSHAFSCRIELDFTIYLWY